MTGRWPRVIVTMVLSLLLAARSAFAGARGCCGRNWTLLLAWRQSGWGP